MDLTAAIAASVDSCLRGGPDPARGSHWVRRYEGPPETTECNQALVIIKPEAVVADGRANTKALARILGLLDAAGVVIRAVWVLSSEQAAREHLVQRHYPRLNDVSKRGAAALSAASAARLRDWLGAAPLEILGGHQFLETYQDCTPYSLEILTRNLDIVKLGTGTYGMRVAVDGRDVVVLNGFHPYQVHHFERPGTALVMMECVSVDPMSHVRGAVIGPTDPRDAPPGSVKGLLLREEHELGIAPVCTRRNAVHISPGPPEAMVSFCQFFSEPTRVIGPEATAFGQELHRRGLSWDQIGGLHSEMEITTGPIQGPLFEVTEDMNWDEAADFIGALFD